MTYDDEMLDKPARAGKSVAGDEITIEIWQGAIEQN